MPNNGSWLDRALGFLAPQVGLRRMRARVASELLVRHYEAASAGRRTQGWQKTIGDANAATGPALSTLRAVARDLVRNNPNAKSALRTITNHVVRTGISAKPFPKNKRALDLWNTWADTTACDSDGRHNLYGLQKLVMRTVVESGEVLVRRRFRRPEDQLPIPLQIQVLDPDHLDTLRTGLWGKGGARIIHGVEFDAIGKRVAYWLFPEHPGSDIFATKSNSVRVPAESILHVYYQERPGQVRGPSWFAPVLLRFKDFDEFEDATLMKQKIAACLAVIISDLDGSGIPLGTTDTTQTPQVDSLEPGWIGHVPQGTTIGTVEPPAVREYSDYTKTTLRAIATGLGVSYEALTGDYSNVNFSSARMARLEHGDQVEDWRWNMLIPQFCEPVWGWAMQAAAIMGLPAAPESRWTAPPLPMIEPAEEGLAHQRRIRNGLATQSQVIREMGEDPDEVFAEMAADQKKLKKLGIILDSDPSQTTQAGNPRQAAAAPAPAEDEPPMKPNGKAPKMKDENMDGEEA